MPIDPNIYRGVDTQYGQKLADLLNPASIRQRQFAEEEQNMGNQLRQMQVMQGVEQMRRAPVVAQREEQQYQAQQAEAQRLQQERAKKVALFEQLKTADPAQQKQLFMQLFPEEAAKEAFRAPAVRDQNQPFLPDGSPNVPFQNYQRSLKPQTGIDSAATKLAREKFEWEKSGGKAPSKPLPTAALKLQQDELDAIGTASALNADLGAFSKQIETGKLPLGMFSNISNQARNYTGQSTEESRNLASFQANLERLRNESLRLNKGVQTEGDAVRAWNEILKNINDPKLVMQRLGEVQKVNERAVQLRKMNVDSIRANYGHDPMDTSARESVGTAYGVAHPADISGLLQKYGR